MIRSIIAFLVLSAPHAGFIPSTPPSAERPTKTEAVQLLRTAFGVLAKGDCQRFASLIYEMEPGWSKEAGQTCSQWKGRSSPDALRKAWGHISVLARSGKWGKFKDMFDAKAVADFLNVTAHGKNNGAVDNLFALVSPDSGALYYWDGKQLKIVHFDV
jgi:hypothetical protein